ncbi:hypothetical protein BDZ97DRAFT_1906286 [Flammula alnicola]|nr:hypothetical protein BDZ97DRAFT_1906286 [Flammula alnicola]
MPSQSSNARSFHFSNSDNDSMDTHDENYGSRSAQKKSFGACVDCKSVKVRCEFVQGEKKCRRCQAKNLPCQPRQRKKRKPAEALHEQDIHIQNLLRQYDQRRAEQKVHYWMSKASTSKMTALFLDGLPLCCTGIPMQQLVLPEIVKHCSLYPEDIQELFSIFFTHVNPYFSILDQNYHTPEKLLLQALFYLPLVTLEYVIVCAVASRYYSARPALYPLAMEFARDLAGQGLVEGHRSVDVCQAYLIMAVYPVPKKKWVEDRSWLLMGNGYGIGIESTATPTYDEREALNRTRTWLNCYCVDGSHAIQFGKVPMLRLDDYLARNSREWYKSSLMNTPFDVHLCAYVQILILMAKWREHIKEGPSKPNSQGELQDVVTSALEMQETLSREMNIWAGAYTEEYMLMPLPICSYRGNTTPMIVAYLRLVVLLEGFQKSKPEDLLQDSEILVKSIDAARSVIQITIERLYPTGYLPAFLINLFRPRHLPLLDDNLQKEIIISVSQLISILGSNDVALDGRHTPALYSRFLSSLMVKHALMMSDMDTLGNEYSQAGGSKVLNRRTTPPDGFNWPDVRQTNTHSGNGASDLGKGSGFQFQGEIVMDYSLSHFIKTVTEYTRPSTEMETDLALAWETWKPEVVQPPMWSQPIPVQGIFSA